jgi:hypothetical protein
MGFPVFVDEITGGVPSSQYCETISLENELTDGDDWGCK